MRRRGALAVAIVAMAGVAVMLPVSAANAAVEPAAPETAAVQWGKCRTYSDEVLSEQSPVENVEVFKRVLARRQCGTVTVPLDYGRPHGRQLKIAITRLRATGPRARLGALAVNPGGPGGSGVLLPAQMSFFELGDLGKRFDMIGFDPRGIGDSTPRLVCEPTEFTSELTTDKAKARQISERQAAANRACAATDPALTASLTTENVARDLDRIRAALREPKLSYVGFSYGTGLGASYQTLFPQRAARLVLDSVDLPEIKLDRMDDDSAAAKERNYRRFTAWIAEHRQVFNLGATPGAVAAEVRRIRQFFAEHPRDVAGLNRVDEIAVANLSTKVSLEWPAAAGDLVKLKVVVDEGRSASATSAAGRQTKPAPEFQNDAVNIAVDCNADTGVRDFEGWFQRWEQRRQRYPVSGITFSPVSKCIGWPHPVQPVRRSDNGAGVLLVGHEFEAVTPVSWTFDMRARIGGTPLILDDDIHASLDFTACARHAVDFLVSGKRPPRRCAGVPVPGPEEERSIASAARKPWPIPGRPADRRNS